MIKYGILSCATIVNRFVKGINESNNGCVTAIASRDINKAKALAKELNINKYYGSYQELYEDKNIDIIYIPTINSLHYQNCLDALKHHKHVIVEKPFTLTKKEAKELFDLASSNNCFIMEGQKSIFLPVTNKIKDLIKSKTIGKIKYLEFKASFQGSNDYNHWMYDLSLGGGTLYGSATYTIEYIMHLFDTTDISIDGSCIKGPNTSDTLCNFQLVTNNILISSTIAMNLVLDNELVIYGTIGKIIVKNYWKADCFILQLHDGTLKHYSYPYNSEFVYEINHINDCINSGIYTSNIMLSSYTIKTVELVEQLQNKWKSA